MACIKQADTLALLCPKAKAPTRVLTALPVGTSFCLSVPAVVLLVFCLAYTFQLIKQKHADHHERKAPSLTMTARTSNKQPVTAASVHHTGMHARSTAHTHTAHTTHATHNKATAFVVRVTCEQESICAHITQAQACSLGTKPS